MAEILKKVRPNILLQVMNKMLKMRYFRTLDAGTSILGEIYNAGNNYSNNEKRVAPYLVHGRHRKCNWTLIKLPKSVANISVQHSQ